MPQPAYLILLILLVSLASGTYYSPCSQSVTRTCSFGTNITDRLLAMKKGGSNIISTNTYDSNFFLCEEYDYNCGYMESPTNFLTVANGVQLNFTYSQLLLMVPSDSVLTNLIKPYLGSYGMGAQCLSSFFPLILTDTQSSSVLSGYLSVLTSNLSSEYTTKKAVSSVSWSNLYMNVITSVLQMGKYYMNGNFVGGSFWSNFLTNNYVGMSLELKQNYASNGCLQCLHSSYLLDSVSSTYNKYQSINFLVDESSSIGSTNFNYVKTFLTNYVTQTSDDTTIMSIQYYDTAYDPSVTYGNSKASILSAISAKSCHCSTNGNLGNAINTTVAKINALNLPNGVPKIIVALVGSSSNDNVYFAAEYARSFGITIICLAIGSGYTNSQLLQASFTQSNLIYITTYVQLPSFYTLLPNILANQYIDIAVNSAVIGNVVRSVANPNYYRVPRSNIANTYYLMTITHGTDPTVNGGQVYQSHYDPFPDQYSDCNCSVTYRTSIYTFQYFIPPKTSQSILQKKDVTSTQFQSYTYFTIAGNNLNFNISLTVCTTSKCVNEVAAAEAIGSLNYDTSLGEDSGSSNIVDPTIFTAVGVGLALLGVGTYATIKGLRKLKEPDEEVNSGERNLQTNQEIEHQNIFENNNQNLQIQHSNLGGNNHLDRNIKQKQNQKSEKHQSKQSWDGSQYHSDQNKSVKSHKSHKSHNDKNSHKSHRSNQKANKDNIQKEKKQHKKSAEKQHKKSAQKRQHKNQGEKQDKPKSPSSKNHQRKRASPKRAHSPKNKTPEKHNQNEQNRPKSPGSGHTNQQKSSAPKQNNTSNVKKENGQPNVECNEE